MDIFFFPQYKRGAATNPYCDDYIKSLSKGNNIVSFSSLSLPRAVQFFIGSFRADLYIVNWLESVTFLRFYFIQFLFAFLGLFIINIRKKRIVWMLHNIHPHEGNSVLSNCLQSYLYKESSLIIVHSREAEVYAKQKAKCPVKYYCHPFRTPYFNKSFNTPYCDIFIWGAILPYKGILEFVNSPILKQSNLIVKIIGTCKDQNLDMQIKGALTENISYENRRADYDEIASYCKTSKVVLFPYVGDCVSSSGALIDTILMGGIPLGPKRGAFLDLESDGCCITYENLEQVITFLERGGNFSIDKKKQQDFCRNNSWDNFANNVLHDLIAL